MNAWEKLAMHQCVRPKFCKEAPWYPLLRCQDRVLTLGNSRLVTRACLASHHRLSIVSSPSTLTLLRIRCATLLAKALKQYSETRRKNNDCARPCSSEVRGQDRVVHGSKYALRRMAVQTVMAHVTCRHHVVAEAVVNG